jgi:hypothetical protein
MEIVRRPFHVHELRIDYKPVCAPTAAGVSRDAKTGNNAWRSSDQVVIKATPVHYCWIFLDRGSDGLIKDVVLHGNIRNNSPQHNLTWPGASKRESIIGDQPVICSVGDLDRPTLIQIVKDIIDDYNIRPCGVDAVVKLQDRNTTGPADIMEYIAFYFPIRGSDIEEDAFLAIPRRIVPEADILETAALYMDVGSAVITGNSSERSSREDKVLKWPILRSATESDIDIATQPRGRGPAVQHRAPLVSRLYGDPRISLPRFQDVNWRGVTVGAGAIAHITFIAVNTVLQNDAIAWARCLHPSGDRSKWKILGSVIAITSAGWDVVIGRGGHG